MLPFRCRALYLLVKNPLWVDAPLDCNWFIIVELLLFFDAMLLFIDYTFACLSPTFLRNDYTYAHSSTNLNSHSTGISERLLPIFACLAASLSIPLSPKKLELCA